MQLGYTHCASKYAIIRQKNVFLGSIFPENVLGFPGPPLAQLENETTPASAFLQRKY